MLNFKGYQSTQPMLHRNSHPPVLFNTGKNKIKNSNIETVALVYVFLLSLYAIKHIRKPIYQQLPLIYRKVTEFCFLLPCFLSLNFYRFYIKYNQFGSWGPSNEKSNTIKVPCFQKKEKKEMTFKILGYVLQQNMVIEKITRYRNNHQ